MQDKEQKDRGLNWDAIMMEERYGAHNYHPLPVVLSRGKGIFLWDIKGNRYYDFLSAYSAVNQGHCHPRIIKALAKQARKLTLTSRAFYNDKLGLAEQHICQLFKYDKALFMNSGAEAVETAIKLARRWGYVEKKIPENEAIIVVVKGNFHGRTTTIISASSEPSARNGFGPYTPGFKIVEYDDIDVLDEVLANSKVCGLMIEPIQGEAGVLVPSKGYLTAVSELCDYHKVLLIIDEIQTGVGRTGKMLASDYENVRADILILGKAISGGVFPVSCVLAMNEVMLKIKPGEHGSTFGGNPLAAEVCMEALHVAVDEKLADNAKTLGVVFREKMQAIIEETSIFLDVRGKGLLNAVVINDAPESTTAWNFCIELKKAGLLAKPTHGNVIRFAPPLVITPYHLRESTKIIREVALNFKK